jgi:hypothetical protein
MATSATSTNPPGPVEYLERTAGACFYLKMIDSENVAVGTAKDVSQATPPPTVSHVLTLDGDNFFLYKTDRPVKANGALMSLWNHLKEANEAIEIN